MICESAREREREESLTANLSRTRLGMEVSVLVSVTTLWAEAQSSLNRCKINCPFSILFPFISTPPPMNETFTKTDITTIAMSNAKIFLPTFFPDLRLWTEPDSQMNTCSTRKNTGSGTQKRNLARSNR